MKNKTHLIINYKGKQQLIEFYFTYTINNVLYAVVKTGKKDVRLVSFKWNPIRGLVANDTYESLAVDVARAIYNEIVNTGRLSLRNHFKVICNYEGYTVKFSSYFFLFLTYVIKISRLFTLFFSCIIAKPVMDFSLIKKKKEKDEKDLKYRRFKKIIYVFSYTVITSLLLFSWVLGINLYPQKTPEKNTDVTCSDEDCFYDYNDYLLNDYFETIKLSSSCLEFETACTMLNSNIWADCFYSERLDVLKTIICYEADLIDISAPNISIAELGATTYGNYNDVSQTIYIDDEHFYNGNVTDVLDTVLHEFRHRQQYYYADCGQNNELYEEYKYGLNNYIESTYDFNSYFSQLVEVDARFWASERIKFYLEYITPYDYESSELFKNLSVEAFYFGLITKESNNDWEYSHWHNYKAGDDISDDYLILNRYSNPVEVEVINIPTNINGIPVEEIDADCVASFPECLEHLYISENVRCIDVKNLCTFDSLSIKVSINNDMYSMYGDNLLVDCSGCLLWVNPKTKGEITLPYCVSALYFDCFTFCEDITDINVDEKNRFFSSADGLLYDSSGRYIEVCPKGKKGSVQIKDGVVEIGPRDFYLCKKITEIIIPPSVKKIFSESFDYCESLSSLTIPSSVEFINDDIIIHVPNIKFLTISKNTEVYGVNSETLTCLRVFMNDNLTDIYYDGTIFEAQSSKTFNNGEISNHKVTIHCSDGNINTKI